jgi:hypothetical protein
MLHSHDLQIQSAHSLAEGAHLEAQIVPAGDGGLVLVQLSLQEGVSVGDAGCDEDLIVVLFESIAEG